MNCIIPFESKIKFDYPVKEICSISLEHEITKNEDELLGNFFIRGTCKEHELSVNTTDYNFTIPFSVEYTNKIDLNTLDFTIDNFTYELLNNELKVNIDYEIKAEDITEDPLELIDESFRKLDINDDKPIKEENEILQPPHETDKEELPLNEVQNDIASIHMEDDYTIYHIHFLKNEDTIESICSLYKTDKEEVLKLNNIDSIEGLTNILIPLKDE